MDSPVLSEPKREVLPQEQISSRTPIGRGYSTHPAGILIAHTLPAIILFILLWNSLAVVWPSYEPETKQLWSALGVVLATVTILSTVYSTILWRRGSDVHPTYAALVFIAYTAVLWLYLEAQRTLFPWAIPRWMLPEDMFLYAFRFLSIPMAHALFVMVMASIPAGDRGRPVRDLLIAAAIPAGCYFFVQVIEPWRWGIDFERHVWIVTFILLVVAFLFFLFRGVVAIAGRVGKKAQAMKLVALSLIAVVFPILGLLLNNGELMMAREAKGAFGDLSHPAFYIIALLNGVVVIWPSSNDLRVRSVQFFLRAIGFTYVAYFFVLFLPFLPLSIAAILAFGLGFLLLAPVMLFIAQGMRLIEDARFLSRFRSPASVITMFSLGMAIIPAGITIHNLQHRSILNQALDHVFHPDLSKDPTMRIDALALEKVLDRIDDQKSNRRGWGDSKQIPFITPYYDKVVLDGLTLSNAKTHTLREIFLNETGPGATGARLFQPERTVVLNGAQASSTWDPLQECWRTWVDLTMTNTGSMQAEYATRFELPEGAWISDEYLMIEGERVPGILAEKKAATWVYMQIVNVRQDPSITRYIAPGVVQLQVFPFAAEETREAGFEILHKEPFNLVVDHETLAMGEVLGEVPFHSITSRDGTTTYISAALKNTLPVVERDRWYHIIVDGSVADQQERQAAISRIERMIAAHGLDPSRITLHITDAYVKSIPWRNDATAQFLNHESSGGFFSDRAIRRILRNACLENGPEAPAIVLAATAADPFRPSIGTWLDDLQDIAACLPEGPSFHVLEQDGGLYERQYMAPEVNMANHADLKRSMPVHAWPDATQPKAYLPVKPGPSIIVHDEVPILTRALYKERDWNDALALEGRWRKHVLHPEGGTNAWRELVRGSFQAQVLTPVTAWMCLENEAQANALLQKQQETLNANAALDASEDQITAMSEPGIWWWILPIVLLLIYRSRSRA